MRVTKEQLPSGHFRYTVDGEVHTRKSRRDYSHASAYRRVRLSDWDVKCGRKVGDVIVFLHGRQDLALKGSPDANRIVEFGAWQRIPGAIEIEAR